MTDAPPAVPLLRRPHDRHRDLRTRHLAAISPATNAHLHTRHLMTSIPPTPPQDALRQFCRCSTPDDHPRPKIIVAGPLTRSISYVATQSRTSNSASSPSSITHAAILQATAILIPPRTAIKSP